MIPFWSSIHSGERYHKKTIEWSLQPIERQKWLADDGTILVHIGLQYLGFTSALARTYLLNPSTTQELQYKAILSAFHAAVDALKAGSSMSDPRIAAKQALQDAGQVSILALACLHAYLNHTHHITSAPIL